MRRAIVVLVLASGCAGPGLNSLSSPLLCYVNYAGSVSDQERTAAELRRRGFSCSDRDVQMGRLDFEAARASASASSVAPPPLYIIPPKQGLNCSTSQNGRETTCW